MKFSGESREERNNRRNREDGERTPRQGELRRGPPGLVYYNILYKIYNKMKLILFFFQLLNSFINF